MKYLTTSTQKKSLPTRRRTLKKIALAVGALCLGNAVFAASLTEIKARGYMTIATEDNYAPLEIFQDGKPTGFTHDVVAELKKYAPFEIRQEILPWTGLLAAVATGKYDAAITGSLVSEERLVPFNFVPPHASATHFSITRAGDDSIKTVADLDGKPFGIQAGSALITRLPELEAMLAKTGGKLGKMIEYTSYPEAYADLANGRTDYVINTAVPANVLAKKRPDVFKAAFAVSGPGFHAWPVAKKDEDLLNFLTEFMTHLRESGKLAELQKKWFGESFPDLPTQPIKSKEEFLELIKVDK